MNKILLNLYCLLAWLLLVTCSIAAVAQVNDIGKVTSYLKTKDGITGKTVSGIFNVQAYADNIIRVRVSKNKQFNSLSYALASNLVPAANAAQIVDDGKNILLSTGMMDIVVEKSPALRIIFKNKKGEIINEDVKGSGFGTSYLGDKISVYKKMQDGERFIGMGEALGNLDKRGTLITLNNMVIRDCRCM